MALGIVEQIVHKRTPPTSGTLYSTVRSLVWTVQLNLTDQIRGCYGIWFSHQISQGMKSFACSNNIMNQHTAACSVKNEEQT